MDDTFISKGLLFRINVKNYRGRVVVLILSVKVPTNVHTEGVVEGEGKAGEGTVLQVYRTGFVCKASTDTPLYLDFRIRLPS